MCIFTIGLVWRSSLHNRAYTPADSAKQLHPRRSYTERTAHCLTVKIGRYWQNYRPVQKIERFIQATASLVMLKHLLAQAQRPSRNTLSKHGNAETNVMSGAGVSSARNRSRRSLNLWQKNDLAANRRPLTLVLLRDLARGFPSSSPPSGFFRGLLRFFEAEPPLCWEVDSGTDAGTRVANTTDKFESRRETEAQEQLKQKPETSMAGILDENRFRKFCKPELVSMPCSENVLSELSCHDWQHL